MSLRKRPALTPKLLAANARNSKRSTGPRTRRGKFFSRLNGWKGGRPTHYPFPMPPGWIPDMSDPDFRKWVLEQMREHYSEAYAIWMRCETKPAQSAGWKE